MGGKYRWNTARCISRAMNIGPWEADCKLQAGFRTRGHSKSLENHDKVSHDKASWRTFDELPPTYFFIYTRG